MSDYKKLIDNLRSNQNNTFQLEAADAIEQLVKERDAAIADLEKCMYYATPKNNNVCNFCKKDMSEYPNKCDGWSDFCECEPKWRGVQEVSE